MYYVMIFVLNTYGGFNCRALRDRPFKTEHEAVEALEHSGSQGYVKKLGSKRPVYENVSDDTKEKVGHA